VGVCPIAESRSSAAASDKNLRIGRLLLQLCQGQTDGISRTGGMDW